MGAVRPESRDMSVMKGTEREEDSKLRTMLWLCHCMAMDQRSGNRLGIMLAWLDPPKMSEMGSTQEG